ncbi:hypothetical protein Tco_0900266 [Tanacetum coccineum]
MPMWGTLQRLKKDRMSEELQVKIDKTALIEQSIKSPIGTGQLRAACCLFANPGVVTPGRHAILTDAAPYPGLRLWGEDLKQIKYNFFPYLQGSGDPGEARHTDRCGSIPWIEALGRRFKTNKIQLLPLPPGEELQVKIDKTALIEQSIKSPIGTGQLRAACCLFANPGVVTPGRHAILTDAAPYPGLRLWGEDLKQIKYNFFPYLQGSGDPGEARHTDRCGSIPWIEALGRRFKTNKIQLLPLPPGEELQVKIDKTALIEQSIKSPIGTGQLRAACCLFANPGVVTPGRHAILTDAAPYPGLRLWGEDLKQIKYNFFPYLQGRESSQGAVDCHTDFEGQSRAQVRMKQYEDQHRSEREFSVRDWVFLRFQPYTIGFSIAARQKDPASISSS